MHSVEQRIAVAKELQAEFRDWVRFADAKASGLFVLASALLGALATLVASDLWKAPADCLTTAELAITIVSLLTATVCTIFALQPRSHPENDDSSFSFPTVAGRTLKEFSNGMVCEGGEEELKQRQAHAHVLSRIATEKFAWISFASWALLAGCGFGVATFASVVTGHAVGISMLVLVAVIGLSRRYGRCLRQSVCLVVARLRRFNA